MSEPIDTILKIMKEHTDNNNEKLMEVLVNLNGHILAMVGKSHPTHPEFTKFMRKFGRDIADSIYKHHKKITSQN